MGGKGETHSSERFGDRNLWGGIFPAPALGSLTPWESPGCFWVPGDGPLALPRPLCTTAVKTQCRGDEARGGDLGLTQNRCEGVCGCAGVCCGPWGPSRPHPSPLPPPRSRARAAPAQGPRRRGSHLGSIPTSSSSLPHSFFSLYIYIFFSSGPFIFAELNP